MDYEKIKRELENSATLKLLRADYIALIISFLYRQFKTSQKNSITQVELEEKLESYLEYLREIEPDTYPRSPKQYLDEWCEKRFLRKTFDKGDTPFFTLTPATEKAIFWVEDLLLQEKESFVGVESRFSTIFDLLKDIQDRSTTDVETRIGQLERDRDRLQGEIDRIRETGVVERYNSTQLKERFLEVDRLTRQLLADFGDIEQNFRDLARSVQDAYLEKDSRKGTIIDRVLDVEDQLKKSDQGQSFNAFWRFLTSESKQQELKSLIEAVYQLEELKSLTQKNIFPQQIEDNLLSAAMRIMESKSQLATKLRQILEERNLKEHRRVAELIHEVQRLAFQAKDLAPTEEDFWTIEGKPDINLVMARPLDSLQESEPPTFSQDLVDLPDISPEEEFAKLYQQFYLDEDLLVSRIERVLEHRLSIFLPDLIQIHPITQGLSEIVAYLSIAYQDDRHCLDTDIIDVIEIPSLEPEKSLRWTVPRVIFRR